MRTERQLERITKGLANHRRIQIMRLLAREPDLSLNEWCARVRINLKTASEHVRRLAISGLVLKRNRGGEVQHALSLRGKAALEMLDHLP